MTLLFSLLFLLNCVVEIDSLNKYKENVQENPFRMNKINQIWHKGQKRLKGHSLADLYADLKIQDGREIQLKRLKADDMDKGGIKEAEVRLKLREIIIRHGLEDVLQLPEVNDINEAFSNDIHADLKDKKLQKLWDKAQKSGFSDNELDDLKKEFWHQQLKLDEFNMLRDDMNSLSDLDNSIDGQEKNDKKIKLKTLTRDIKDGYDKLATLGGKKPFDNSEPGFKDKRVYELYALARKSNMTQDELDSFIEELRHFENRINKHEYLKEELQIAESVMSRESKDGQMPQKHITLKQKADEYGSKVKKYHATLQNKVNRALGNHVEL